MPHNLQATLKRMDELQIAFTAKLGDKVKELSRLILQLDGTALPQQPDNQQLFSKIKQLSHNLAGTAGTFKHTAVYNKAKAIEILSSEMLEKTDYSVNWHRLLLELIVGLRGDIQVSGRPLIVESFSSCMIQAEEQPADNVKAQPYYPVIVVDDDELLVRLIKEQAKHFEYDVIGLLTTDNLEEAVDQYQPTAILIDVVFPDAKHSGIEIINQLKVKNKINCPVIFMSNRCDTAVRLDALRAGSNAYIVKPLDILELIRVLDRLTQKLTKQKFKILIVDDEPLTAKFYQTALNNDGFICEIVLNPMTVMDKALSFSPDAILLDINMPDCDGFELAEIIRQDDSFSHIPILFLTVTNSHEQEIHAVKSGGDDFLDKNAPLPTLIAIIKGHVHRYKELDSLLSRLKRDEIRFRSVTSSSNDAIISTDEKNRIVFWNEGAENIFGYHALEIIGQPLELIIPQAGGGETQHKDIASLIADKTQQSIKHSVETTAITKSKVHIDIELTYTEWVSANQHFYTHIIRDVTERKQIELELSYKEAYLNAIISNSGEAIITINSEGIIETANPKARQLFGYRFDEMLGKNISMLMPSPVKELHDSYLAQSELMVSRRIEKPIELKGLRKDGSIFALELNVSLMMIAGKRKFVGILHDVSERQQFVHELLLAKAGAEAASQAKTQFLSSMSHELRTPLNAIMGFTQILQSDVENPMSEEQQHLLDYIYSGGVRLLSLINDVLDLSKIETEALTLKKEKFDLVQFMTEAVEQIKPLAGKSDLIVNSLSNKREVFIETDKAKLKQSISHLLSNAIKYNNPQGKITVLLTSSNKKVRLSITDTGKGIPEHKLSELFKPFNRLGEEVGTIEGTGIGLTLTKKLIEIMNGQIGVSSKVNEGTTFWIELEKVA